MGDGNGPVEVELPFIVSAFMVPQSCEYFYAKITSTGLFTKDNPLRHPIPLLMLQISSALLVSSLFHRLLRPLKQPRFVSDMLTGVLLGPFLFQYTHDLGFYQSLFQGKQSVIVEVLEILCFVYYSFLVGIRTDLSVVKTSGRRAWIIGLATFALPIAISFPGAHFLGKKYQDIAEPLDSLYALVSTTSFHVTAVLLSDLNLLNSEIGQLALSSALISNLFGLIFKAVTAYVQQVIYLKIHASQIWGSEMCRILTILFILYVLRRAMFWMLKKIPEGKPIREWHFSVVMILLLAVSFWCELFGMNAYFGSLILGFAIPAGPPMGSGVMEKLGIIVSTLFVPCYIIDSGRRIIFSQLNRRNLGPTEVVIFLAYLGKVVAAVVPSRFFRMPNSDALSLGLVLCSQGFFDVMFFKRALRFSLINEEMYSILCITAVINSALFTPLICHLYNPSKRYVNYRRRTIQHTKRDWELRLLICLHEEESAFGVMNLLKASCPTREHPLGIYVLDLMELSGREHPLHINHQLHKRHSSILTRTDRILNSFRHFESQNEGLFRVQNYTAFTPYPSMHDDICITALEKSISLIIIPYQRHENRAVRLVKKNVLEKAPCSVGFLIDKKICTYFVSDAIKVKTFHVCIIFFGGPDSREALAYGARMVESLTTKITVIRLMAEDGLDTDLAETKNDLRVINEFRCLERVNERIEYKEVVVLDGEETSKVLMSLEDVYDFILVGKRIDKKSSLVSGLTEWNNNVEAELGIIGDILASSDMRSKASVLVLQQQITVEDLMKKQV